MLRAYACRIEARLRFGRSIQKGRSPNRRRPPPLKKNQPLCFIPDSFTILQSKKHKPPTVIETNPANTQRPMNTRPPKLELVTTTFLTFENITLKIFEFITQHHKQPLSTPIIPHPPIFCQEFSQNRHSFFSFKCFFSFQLRGVWGVSPHKCGGRGGGPPTKAPKKAAHNLE